jgi:beta-phosphoglucomutase
MRLMAERCSVDIYLYRAALFDMDGVITDTMPLHYESWKRAFAREGIDVEKMDVYLREGMTSTAMAREIAAAKGRDMSDDEIMRIVDEKTMYFGEMVNEYGRAYEGVNETLRMLRNNGVALALVTGSKRESVDAVLKKTGLEGAFDVIVGAEDVTSGKPGPEPYLSAMRELDMPALDCLAIENAPLGIKSAKAAKAGYVIAIATTLDPSYLQEADEVDGSFSDLEQCFARRFEMRPGRAIM